MTMCLEGYVITPHAIDRALDMGVAGEEIRQCLLNPDSVTKSRKHKGFNHRAGRITCGVVQHRVVTVVWSSKEGWRDDLGEGHAYGGRTYRGD
ncbi:hypothetical protein A5747_13715 [Mycobacterium sp. IS-836]|uniref:hypothetical protein n=1 Tax=Mycobacterium sp. IS-836 TaxID=1834160 RepID=UPI00096D1BA3|nr:hypothetical protein [Mycobacterium sp. IS-836]OMC55441.1 hypothetical protein A5747_13715 [Mycobacterium sp. IS-836]